MPIILIDTREQKPWTFGRIKTAKRTLTAGDYSVDGYEARVMVERKSLDDLANCLDYDSRRFESQLRRLQKIKYRAVIVEGGMTAIHRGRYYRGLSSVEFVARVTDYMVRYKVPILFGECVGGARDLALSFLKSGVRQCKIEDGAT